MHRTLVGHSARIISAPVRVHGRRHLQQRFVLPIIVSSSSSSSGTQARSRTTAPSSTSTSPCSPSHIRYHAFSTSSRSCKEEGAGGGKDSKSKSSSSSKSDSGGAPGRSPFAVFVDVLKEELQKSRELQDNVKQLQGEAGQVMDSEAMKKAKAVYERARVSRQGKRGGGGSFIHSARGPRKTCGFAALDLRSWADDVPDSSPSMERATSTSARR